MPAFFPVGSVVHRLVIFFLGAAGLTLASLAAVEPAGFVLARNASGQRVPIPLESTEVVLEVKPGLLEAEVIQTFTNRTGSALEATYFYPLPGDATLTAFELRFADRVVRSEVREKAEARAAYDAARADGKKAALLEQHDPTLFSTAVANFLPGETVRVALRFLQPLALSTTQVDVRFPMVTGKKYFPAEATPGAAGNAAPDPLRRTDDAFTANHVYSFDIQIAGLPVQAIESPSHRVQSVRTGESPERHRVALAEEITIPDRDFVLRLQLREAETPQATVVTQHTATGDYGLVTVFPARTLPPGSQPPRPRDVLFLIDRSGSMDGTRIASARAGLERCLAMLAPHDRFQLVLFDSGFEFYRPGWTPATDEELHTARATARNIPIRGGTELQPALAASLRAFEANDREHILLLLTDGDVGNEASLLNLVETQSGATRLFTFGIGSVPNTSLLERIARLGHGQARFIANDADVARELTHLFLTLQTPVLQELRLALFDAAGQPLPHSLLPEHLPEVFLGRPLQAVFRSGAGAPATLLLEGREAGRLFQQRIVPSLNAQRGDGLEKLYGQQLYAETALLLRRATSEPERVLIRQELLATALQFQLVTELTSRVAIDRVRSRDPNAPVVTERVGQYHAADQNTSGDVVALTAFMVSDDAERTYLCCALGTAGSRLVARDVLGRELLDQLGIRTLEEAAPFALNPQADAATSRAGAGRGLLDGLPVATLVDPATVNEISLALSGPAHADISQLRVARNASAAARLRWSDDGRAGATLRIGRSGILPALVLLSAESKGAPRWGLFATTEKSFGATTLSAQLQARELGGYGDTRLVRAALTHRLGATGLLKATIGWHELRRDDAQQFALGAPHARHDGLGFLNLDLLTAPTRHLADLITQLEWSERRATPALSHTWFARARWHRQEADWFAPVATGSELQRRDNRELALSYTAGFARDRLLLTTDLDAATHDLSSATERRTHTSGATLGFELKPAERVSVFGQWRRGQTLPWIATGRWENTPTGWRATTPAREAATETQLGLSVQSTNRRTGAVLSAFHETIRDRSYRDWAWERAHPGVAFVPVSAGAFRAAQGTNRWPQLTRAGLQGIASYNPSGAFTLRLSGSIDGRDDGPYRGGNRRGSALARYEFRSGAWRGFSAGLAVNYRNALTFDDGVTLRGGLRGNALFAYRGFARGRQGPTLQFNVFNLAGRAEQLTRFAETQGRRVQFTVDYGF